MAREYTGTVKWFSSEKGYGFIELDGDGPDVFLHYSALEMPGYKTVDDGARVRLQIVNGNKGPQAHKVHVDA